MNKIHILNMLHEVFLRLRNTSHFVFIFVLVIIIIAQSNIAFGESLVPHVETKLSVSYDGQKKSFVATQNTVEGALAQGGIVLGANDVTNPRRDANLTGQATEISVTRALPVLISDNGKESLEFSAYSDASEILRQLNFTTYPEDKIISELILDPVSDNAVGQKVIIERAPVYTVQVDGEEKVIRSWGTTVAEILKDNIPLGAKDIVEPPLEAGIIGDITIKVTRVNEAEVEESKTVPFQTVYKDDYTMYQGKSSVSQEGTNGEIKQLVKIIYHNGVEIDRQVLSSETISTVVNKVVVRGVKPYDAGALWDILVAAGNKYGVDPAAMYRVMMCESGGRVNAGTTYKGLFQWDGSFYNWAAKAGFPGADIYDPTAQIYATALRVSQNGWSAWGCKP